MTVRGKYDKLRPPHVGTSMGLPPLWDYLIEGLILRCRKWGCLLMPFLTLVSCYFWGTCKILKLRLRNPVPKFSCLAQPCHPSRLLIHAKCPKKQNYFSGPVLVSLTCLTTLKILILEMSSSSQIWKFKSQIKFTGFILLSLNKSHLSLGLSLNIWVSILVNFMTPLHGGDWM